MEEDQNAPWVVAVEHELKQDGVADPAAEAARWRKHSVYRVPAHIKKYGNHSPYEPQLVSLGPFHHGRGDLQPMEEHKRRALLHLLRRTRRRAGDLAAAVEAVAEALEDAYMDLDADTWRSGGRDRFVEVMVTDGCFLLEVMRTAELNGGEADDDYAANDPVFSRHGDLYVFPYIRRDMLMMENQLPLLVLQRLVSVIRGPDKATDDAINDMVLRFVSLTPDPPAISGGGLALHPIDVCHRSLLHGGSPQPPITQKGREDDFVPSATELEQAGVRFSRSPTHSLRDISFLRGTLYIPLLAVDDTTEHKLFSLMAYERLHPGAAANEVTAYVFFMDSVIKSADDVRLLSSGGGVISNGLGSDKAVAGMFNRLAKNAVLDRRSPLRRVQGQVNDHRENAWNEWRASLIRNHAGNPWAIVFLLLLTVVQTVYTVLPYYDHQQQPPWPSPPQTQMGWGNTVVGLRDEL